MKACWCTLPYTNPDACKGCSNYENVDNSGNYWDYPSYPTVPYPQFPTKTVKRTTKTIEKYGPDGEYLGKEVITTDEEDIQVQDWSSGSITITSGDAISWDGVSGHPVTGCTTTWDPNDPKNMWSYTSSVN